MPWLAGESVFDGASGTWESQAWWSDAWDQQFGLNGTLPVVNALNNLTSNKREIQGILPSNWTMRDGYAPDKLIILGSFL